MIKIFYSWQSDLKNKYNWSFIESSLKKAVKQLKNNKAYKLDFNIERDTKNVKGTPNVSETIFEKIAESHIFIADVTLINSEQEKNRKTPNPNVLTELGYAAGILGWDNILMVYNKSYGTIEELPFDLKGRRPIVYEASDDIEIKESKEKLTRLINYRLTEIIQDIDIIDKDVIAQSYTFFSNNIFKISLELDELIRYVNTEYKLGYDFTNGVTKDEIELIRILSNIETKKPLELKHIRVKPFRDIFDFIGFKERKIRNIIGELLRFNQHLTPKIIGKLTRISVICSESLDMEYKTLGNKKLDVWIPHVVEAITLSKNLISDFNLTYKQQQIVYHQNFLKKYMSRAQVINDEMKKLKQQRKKKGSS